MKKRIIKKDIDTFNDIVVTRQGDDVQRSGVLTLNQEKMLLEKAGKVLSKTIEKNVKELNNEIVEQKKLQESIDIFDEKRKLEKSIEENTKKYNKLKEEQKQYIEILKKEQERVEQKKPEVKEQ